MTHAAGIGEVGVLAKSIEDHHGHRAVVHAGEQHQAMASLVGETGFGQLDVPIVLGHQVVGIAKAQAVSRVGEKYGPFPCGAQLAEQRVVARCQQQFGQVAGSRNVEGRQPRRFHIARFTHAQGSGFRVHGGDEGAVTARVVVGQGRGCAVFRGHQGDMQHVAAVELAAEPNAGINAFHFPVLGYGHRQDFIHRLLCIEYDHCGHQLGHRGDRLDLVGVA
ncbi:hypothetical protein D9M71_254870 [compost metagenome]